MLTTDEDLLGILGDGEEDPVAEDEAVSDRATWDVSADEDNEDMMEDPFLDLSSVFRFAWPNSTLRHLAAKLREHNVSLRLYTAGEMLTNISTFEFPPNESWQKVPN